MNKTLLSITLLVTLIVLSVPIKVDAACTITRDQMGAPGNDWTYKSSVKNTGLVTIWVCVEQKVIFAPTNACSEDERWYDLTNPICLLPSASVQVSIQADSGEPGDEYHKYIVTAYATTGIPPSCDLGTSLCHYASACEPLP